MRFGLAGNPNSGKTTLFNLLTGSSAYVGNWPGVTVDKKIGNYKRLPEKIEIVDLPGIYSLSPYSPEEIISRNFLLNDKVDCIINIVDATNLERNLYLTTQLLELDIPIVVALNMIDAVNKDKVVIDAAKLSAILNIPVCPISALKGLGIQDLMQTAYQSAKKARNGFSILASSQLSKLYQNILELYQATNSEAAVFKSIKMIEGDTIEVTANDDIALKAAEYKAEIDTGIFKDDFEGIVADARYRFITDNLCLVIKKEQAAKTLSKSDKIDRVLTHRILGIPIFLLIMLSVFHLTFSKDLLFIGSFIPKGSFDIPIIGRDAINSPGIMLFSAMELLTEWLGAAVSGALPEGTWYTSLICNGFLSGIFAVLTFLPQIMVLFLFISILEDSGYMARVAFIMDRAFRGMGLSGKSLMPLIMCFGCAVPGIMATRTLDNDQERKRTIMMTPFFSCGAKLPIWAAFAGVFASVYAGMNAEVIVFSMYLLGIIIAILAAFLLKKTLIKGKPSPFIMELPNYHAPKFSNTIRYLWQKLSHFLFRATTVIAGATIVIWFLSSFNFQLKMVDSSDSIIGIIAEAAKYLFIPLGFGMAENGGKFVIAAITGLIAKEMVVATMGTLSGVDDKLLGMDGNTIAGTALGTLMLSIGGSLGGINVAIPAMFSFMAFNLLGVPCMAAVAAAKGELRKGRTFWFAISFWFLTAYIVSAIIFWFGTLMIACWWAALIIVILFFMMMILLILKSRRIIHLRKKIIKAG